jgi:hypothetical protein
MRGQEWPPQTHFQCDSGHLTPCGLPLSSTRYKDKLVRDARLVNRAQTPEPGRRQFSSVPYSRWLLASVSRTPLTSFFLLIRCWQRSSRSEMLPTSMSSSGGGRATKWRHGFRCQLAPPRTLPGGACTQRRHGARQKQTFVPDVAGGDARPPGHRMGRTTSTR